MTLDVLAFFLDLGLGNVFECVLGHLHLDGT
jgi:hypothetical protein